MYYAIGYGVAAAFLALMLMWLDTKLLDNYKEKSTYIKSMLMVGVITALIVYFIGENNIGSFKMSGGGSSSSQFGVSYLPSIREEIMTGPPNF